jgi:hypothetical protein
VVKGVPPHIMGIGPAMGIPAVLEQCQLTVLEDIDVFEINKAFALQATWCVDVLKIDPSKVNPNGGAIALGHPLGCTGTRQIATLLRKLHRKKNSDLVLCPCVSEREWVRPSYWKPSQSLVCNSIKKTTKPMIHLYRQERSTINCDSAFHYRSIV